MPLLTHLFFFMKHLLHSGNAVADREFPPSQSLYFNKKRQAISKERKKSEYIVYWTVIKPGKADGGVMGVMSSSKHGVSRGSGVKTSGGKSTAKAGTRKHLWQLRRKLEAGGPGGAAERSRKQSQRGAGGRCQDWGVYSEWEPGDVLGARLEELLLPLC